jgi:chemotaxis protein methyltransferase CheR
MVALGIDGLPEYRAYLESHPSEWTYLDGCTRISISRFYRDRGVFDHLRDEVLPQLAATIMRRSDRCLRAWSIGCASGEEPYSLAILWQLNLQSRYQAVELLMIATDLDDHMIHRAQSAVYPASSLKDVPEGWRLAAFDERGGQYAVRPEFKRMVEFQQQDVRRELPTGPFDLVLCRNLVFTYFEPSLQREVLANILNLVSAGGFLVTGKQEALVEPVRALLGNCVAPGIYRLLQRLE